ncbi:MULTISPECIES: TetR/AcrR family transcriptional regulator [unclassified Saccharopolyspora]|uniref:TetR/AcrR family transcriptional regulator n=1 Tax=Saccharopolyspora TaxID=1835 RepID=UPI00190D434F|nr:TetR/AcrR family transcriptional regulator [Saccharopolyspora sp. HNM0986]MBK0870886.1 helix-turn-helix transcriptional regulator [Saccharopolyspora sp. HNM0986]
MEDRAPEREPRERNPRGQGERLRDEVLAALVRLVGDEERMRPLPLSLREVAREAGVTAPALYRHFADKEELGRAAEQDGFARLVAAMDAADEAAAGGAPSERLIAVAQAYCRFALENLGYFRIMFKAGMAGFDEMRTVPSSAEQLAERWRAAVVRLREQGIELSQSPEQAAMFVWSSVHGRLTLSSAVEAVWPLGDVFVYVEKLVDSLVKTGLPRLSAM